MKVNFSITMNLNEALPILKEMKIRGRLVLFIGSGISINSGLPTWKGLMIQILDLCEDILSMLKKKTIKYLTQIIKLIPSLLRSLSKR